MAAFGSALLVLPGHVTVTVSSVPCGGLLFGLFLERVNHYESQTCHSPSLSAVTLPQINGALLRAVRLHFSRARSDFMTRINISRFVVADPDLISAGKTEALPAHHDLQQFC